ncbi:activator of 90 kDa heat shock protein ATPase homolog 1 [Thrips palmi]|uniref:Activator of 90 kDa heat shock protein ATPase homolog 1 n=1 Tax=Thrips palmi TaxID=161013 RepID=A0A6P9A4C0_THRPL|nr:activator of 90 kDa heat shock protein ATPase homolog 1 [Thrips palmi]XP_034252717.1 activator of 90 kDa heat shock protein ATPase homolog 1 [Thrips palmi]
MAKWGEGDPRWIVEERPDATNVNNWHWTEKNACQWSEDKLKELLKNLKIENDNASCEITEVEKLEGEAVVNNRKGKLIFFYEYDITLKWRGSMNDNDEEAEGKINIPNLSEENRVDEIDVSVSLDKNTEQGYRVKAFMHSVGTVKIKEQLGKYISALKEEFSRGMILPKKGGDSGTINTNDSSVNNLSAGFNIKMQMNTVAKPTTNTVGCKIDTTTITFSHAFQCTAKEFYNVLTVIEMVQAFTQGPAKLEVKKGGKFELFGGNIHGEFLEIVPDQKIVQRWRSKRWPGEHYSNVTILIDQKDDHTSVKVTQTGVPSSEADGTRENWDRYYMDAIKRTFGFGSFIG